MGGGGGGFTAHFLPASYRGDLANHISIHPSIIERLRKRLLSGIILCTQSNNGPTILSLYAISEIGCQMIGIIKIRRLSEVIA